jgi:hypothetical protein
MAPYPENLGRFSDIEEAREHFYPDYWIFPTPEGSTPPAAMRAAHYVVRYANDEDLRLAYLVRPPGITADIRPAQVNHLTEVWFDTP